MILRKHGEKLLIKDDLLKAVVQTNSLSEAARLLGWSRPIILAELQKLYPHKPPSVSWAGYIPIKHTPSRVAEESTLYIAYFPRLFVYKVGIAVDPYKVLEALKEEYSIVFSMKEDKLFLVALEALILLDSNRKDTGKLISGNSRTFTNLASALDTIANFIHWRKK